MRRVAVVLVLVLIGGALMLALAPMALAAEDPAGCTTTYVGSVGNPPAGADPVICEGRFCTEGVGVNPSAVDEYANHAAGATTTYVNCVV